jgi:hypothetical protein
MIYLAPRGRTFGTILVERPRHEVIDMGSSALVVLIIATHVRRKRRRELFHSKDLT